MAWSLYGDIVMGKRLLVGGLILILLVAGCAQPSVGTPTPIPAPASKAAEASSQAEITEPSQTPTPPVRTPVPKEGGEATPQNNTTSIEGRERESSDNISGPVDNNLAGLGTVDLKQFMKGHFGELPLPSLRELSHSLRDFCQYRKDSAHAHIPRYEEEIRELEQMRELVLGIKRASVITQIFQLFGTEGSF